MVLSQHGVGSGEHVDQVSAAACPQRGWREAVTPVGLLGMLRNCERKTPLARFF